MSISPAAWRAPNDAYDIEAACLQEMKQCLDMESFSRAVEMLVAAPRIGASGCGHSGIICRHFAHLMCCVERPARFISPAEAVHGATGFLQPGDVMVFASRGGKTAELLPILKICQAKKVWVITWRSGRPSCILTCLFDRLGAISSVPRSSSSS